MAYPRIFKQFVVTYEGSTLVLDLKTNSLSVLSGKAGGDEESGSELAIEQYSNAGKASPTDGSFAFDQMVIDLSQLPDLTPCG